MFNILISKVTFIESIEEKKTWHKLVEGPKHDTRREILSIKASCIP